MIAPAATATPIRWHRITGAPAAAPVAVAVLALLIGGLGFWLPGAWSDEGATMVATDRSLGQLIKMVGRIDAVHAAYYGGAWLWGLLFGHSVVALRAISVVAIAGLAAVMTIWGRRTIDVRFGVQVGVITALLPEMTWAATEARSAAVSTLAYAITVWLLSIALERRRWGWWLGYGLALTVTVWLFLFAALGTLGLGAMMLLSRPDRRSWRAWLIATAVAGATALPLARQMLRQSKQVNWIEGTDLTTVVRILTTQTWDNSLTPPGWIWPAVLGWLLCAAATVLVVRRGTADLRRVLLAGWAWWGLPTVALAIAGLLRPTYVERYVAFAAPGLAVVLAAGVWQLLAEAKPGWSARVRGLVATALILLAVAPGWYQARLPEAKSTWIRVAEHVDAVTAPGDSIVYIPHHRNVARSLPAYFDDLVDINLGEPYGTTSQLWDISVPVADVPERWQDLDHLWVLSKGERFDHPDMQTLLGAGFEVVSEWSYDGSYVYELRR
ncbi:glycosyltransferase family 39 protein [Parenemella sanctibonifatiensis]|uniref:Uncharacterized protein n=1 Tax=Parenemella sanctibonifatiensis TaxID=2016505 RepID=A0A255ES68_9ACTN|nr:glycosyltransferase family 39 protein [Parenemella sanctibonifatiensis]OYN92435.1 hypothetical protein CGZ91_02780 [Parenemella sanctibonifatiensis]